MFFEAYFYLTKRFGEPEIYDDYKDAGVWNFEVKDYTIQIYLNSVWVQFMIFGKYSGITLHSPYWVKHRREVEKKSDLIIPFFKEFNDSQQKIYRELLLKFAGEHEVNKDISQEEFDKKYGMRFYKCCMEYNDKIIDINVPEFIEKYGDVYQNAYTRHALRTLEQFIKNMLTAIWVRDCAFNIKGRMSDEEVRFYDRYTNNIKIEFQRHDKETI